jgi:hypothetical protein
VTPQERQAKIELASEDAQLGEMRRKAKEVEVNAYRYIKILAENPETLKASGYPSLDDAVKKCVERTNKELQRILKD